MPKITPIYLADLTPEDAAINARNYLGVNYGAEVIDFSFMRSAVLTSDIRHSRERRTR